MALEWVRRGGGGDYTFWLSGNNGQAFEILEQWEVFSADENGDYTEEWDSYSHSFVGAVSELIGKIGRCPDLVQKKNWLWVSPYGYAIALDYLCYVGDFQDWYEHSFEEAAAWFEKNYG